MENHLLPKACHHKNSIILETKSLCKSINTTQGPLSIFKHINLKINMGSSQAITGASGSGKTTLLTLLAGLDLPTSGEIFFQDQCLSALNEEARASLRLKLVGFIFQSFQLLPHLTALENVMLPLELQNYPASQAQAEAENWLEKVGLSSRASHYPAQLSGGEQQRTAIARAFIHSPILVFADEVTGNLDPYNGRIIMDLLFDLNQQQATTLVIVTHDKNLARRCEQQLVL